MPIAFCVTFLQNARTKNQESKTCILKNSTRANMRPFPWTPSSSSKKELKTPDTSHSISSQARIYEACKEKGITPLTKGRHSSIVKNQSPMYTSGIVRKRRSPRSLATSAAKEKSSNTSVIYDKDWAQKQSNNFKNMINFILHPIYETIQESDENVLKKLSKQMDLPSHTFRTILLNRQWGQAKKKAIILYNNTDIKSLRASIEKQVNMERIAFRKDRDILADVSLRSFMIDIFTSYDALWLKLALETMFNIDISLDEKFNHDCKDPSTRKASKHHNLRKQSKEKFILKNTVAERVLGDPTIMMKFTGGKYKVLSGKFDQEYRTELRKKVLFHILVLIAFLDRLKNENLLQTNPSLFAMNLKSSNEVLILVCRECLAGEGNIIKHLARFGVKLNYVQRPIDNYDFNVTNLAIDLRDGVRLARIVEILSEDKSFSLSSKMRLPAVSRLQKLHNVEVVLQDLSRKGISCLDDIAPSHIVDGHCQRTLKLIWSIIAKFKLCNLIDPIAITQEIDRIQSANKRRFQLILKQNKSISSCNNFSFDDPPATYKKEVTSLLLQWCQAVCSIFGCPISNFTTSFADGRALCYIIHYYHPRILNISEILPTSRDRNKEWESSNSTKEEKEDYIQNEQHNSATANSRMSIIGGVPNMLPITDSLNIPEEKSMIICLTYLCSRMIECSKEIHATLTIQSCYKRYRGTINTEKRIKSALHIFNFWLKRKNIFLEAKRRKYIKAVHTIENFVLNHNHVLLQLRKERLISKRRSDAAIIIQTNWRMKSQMRRYSCILEKVINLQDAVRNYFLRSKEAMLEKMRKEYAAILIQRFVRKRYKIICLECQSAMVIQSNYRRYRQKAEYNYAATTIQKKWRSAKCRDEFLLTYIGCIIIQSFSRLVLCRKSYLTLKQGITKIQALERGRSVRKRILLMDDASKKIQILYKGFVKRKNDRFTKLYASRKIQAFIRSFLVHRKSKNNEKAACLIQQYWRGSNRRRALKSIMTKVVKIQSIARLYLNLVSLEKKRNAAMVIQKKYREHHERLSYIRALITIQAFFRGMIVRRNKELLDFAANEILRVWRGFVARLSFMNSFYSAIMIQKAIRRHLVVNELNRMNKSAIQIQKVLRGGFDRKNISLKRIASVYIQNAWRKYRLVAQKQIAMTSIVKLQSIARMYLMKVYVASKIDRAKKELDAVIIIQRNFRGMLTRSELELDHFAAAEIQRVWRGFICRYDYYVIIDSVIMFQRAYRRHIISDKKEKDSASCDIQRVWLGYSTRKSYRKAFNASVLIQAHVRVFLANKAYKEMKMMIQSLIIMQSFARMCLVRKKIAIERFACSIILRVWRGYKARVDFNNFVVAVTKVQSFIRGHQAERFYLKAKFGMMLFQRTWREAKLLKHISFCFYSTEIQRVWRGYRVRCLFKVSIQAVIFIQSKARQRISQKKYEITKRKFASKATHIQRIWRGYRANVEYIILLLSAIKIQSVVRRFIFQKQMKSRATRIIQGAARKYIQKNVQRYKLENRIKMISANRAARIIQSSARRYLYMKMLMTHVYAVQQMIRTFLARSNFLKMKKGFTLIQSIHRARAIRRESTRKVRHALKKIIQANKNAKNRPDMILGVRTTNALMILQKSSRLSLLMKATMMLEISTRLSTKCCVNFCIADAPSVLYNLMRTCNRSLPHIELLQYILKTMLNVADHSFLIPKISSLDAVEILIDIIQMFRDKEDLFILTTELLEKICIADQKFLVSLT